MYDTSFDQKGLTDISETICEHMDRLVFSELSNTSFCLPGNKSGVLRIRWQDSPVIAAEVVEKIFTEWQVWDLVELDRDTFGVIDQS